VYANSRRGPERLDCAATLNALFDEWRRSRSGDPIEGLVRFGTVDWLFREYKQTKAYLEKVSQRSRRAKIAIEAG
jgi:hypothetical protein